MLKVKNYIGYRSEEPYGSEVKDLLTIFDFETKELDNKDIIDYLKLGSIKRTKKAIIQLVKRGFKYGIWLCATPLAVKKYYQASKQSIYSVKVKEGIILSDLGEEGKLIAYK